MTKSEICPRTKLDEALIEHIKTVLGEKNGDAFARLWAEYLHLQMRFNDLKNGFGGDDPPMIQLWAICPEFEKQYRNMLIETIVLAACRLTDKRTVAGKKTISISVLQEWFAKEPNLKNLKRLISTATTLTKTALRTWRNSQLAHTAEERERPAVSGNDVEAAVKALHKVLAFVWEKQLNRVPEVPRPRPTSATLGEHLSLMHKRTANFEAWLMKAAKHDTPSDIYDATAAVRRLAIGLDASAVNPGNEEDPVVEFLMGAHEAREIADKIARQTASIRAAHSSASKGTANTERQSTSSPSQAHRRT